MPPTPSSATPGSAEIGQAARLLRAGGLVVFPTETVYGLGANALDEKAVARIYAVKGRPPTSPLIVHVASIEMARSLVAAWPETADRLAKKFWPGPLTLVLAKLPVVPDIVTAGLQTVGLRMPAHPVALALINAAEVPLAAPSANRFTELSPTTADHVRDNLGNEVDLILDGGPCQVGIESTVLSLAETQPVLLRPGGISRADLEALVGPIASAQDFAEDEHFRRDGARPVSALGGAHPSPGMHPRHYAPRTLLFLVANGRLPEQGKGIYLQHRHPPSISRSEPPGSVTPLARVTAIQMPAGPVAYAAALYEKLHQADDAHADWIAVDGPPATPEWEAVMDRLRRAATGEKARHTR